MTAGAPSRSTAPATCWSRGQVRPNVDFGGGELPPTGTDYDIFVAKYSGLDGSYRWAQAHRRRDDDSL